MSKTFEHLRSEKTALAHQDRQQKRWAKRQRQNDAFCSYLLGSLDAEGVHAQGADPMDRAYKVARNMMERG